MKGRPELPARELLLRQAQRLAPIRTRLLRRLDIARRKSVLDLGAGFGAVTVELARRCEGVTVAFDRHAEALRSVSGETVVGEASALPFSDGSFDLVFAQVVLLWNPHFEPVLCEVWRVLQPGGAFLSVEPDYGGLIEFPDELALKDVWVEALIRAGADPFVGRRVPVAMGRLGFEVRVDLPSFSTVPDADRFEFLADLGLTDQELERLSRVRRLERELPPGASLVNLPFLCTSGIKPG